MLMSRLNVERFMMGVRVFDAAGAMALASAPERFSPAELRAWLYERTYGEPLPKSAAEEANSIPSITVPLTRVRASQRACGTRGARSGRLPGVSGILGRRY